MSSVSDTTRPSRHNSTLGDGDVWYLTPDDGGSGAANDRRSGAADDRGSGAANDVVLLADEFHSDSGVVPFGV